jgi:hypothetical protein
MTAQRRARGFPPRREARVGRRRAQILCVASLWICSAASARPLEVAEPAPPASREIAFSPPEGRFSALLPAEPVVSTVTRRTFLGAVVGTRYVVEIGDTTVAVELHDLPRMARLLVPANAILGRARDRLVEDVGTRVVAARDALRGGFPAREVTYELERPARIEEALLVLVERRLYIALATWPRGSAIPPAARRLFESFEVWPP